MYVCMHVPYQASEHRKKALAILDLVGSSYGVALRAATEQEASSAQDSPLTPLAADDGSTSAATNGVSGESCAEASTSVATNGDSESCAEASTSVATNGDSESCAEASGDYKTAMISTEVCMSSVCCWYVICM
jgi:hypothetical protein